MTKNELLNEVLRGVLVIVGEYRGSHAEEAGYIDWFKRERGQTYASLSTGFMCI